MIHSFDSDIAKQYGLVEAILLQNFAFWIAKNEANERNYFDGRYWTYNSIKAFQELFPYLTKRKIEYAISKLIDKGVLQTGNYNSDRRDRTVWYALTDFGKCIVQNCEMHSPVLGNASADFVKCINTDNKQQIINTDNISRRFARPSVEEVNQYCKEAKLNVNAQQFVDYYDSNGWKVGKNAMKDWKAACRGWSRRENANKNDGKMKRKPSFDIDEIARRAKMNEDYEI